ncbi:GNAT family N-acetyltransferase [Streptomyces sp. NPDC006512]|uniref:GNAT family N-acetyltransferase n=1 Tax=Streptomyces sp. NPDC006512 TaxID=3154307 RepID=UPI0033A6DBBA
MTLIRRIDASDWARLLPLLTDRWGAPYIVKHHTRFDLDGLPGLLATTRDGGLLGLLTWTDGADGEAELLTLDALTRRQGTGGTLLDAYLDRARPAGVRRVRVTVTNDQLTGLKLLQRRGFRIEAVRRGAVDAARAVKPQIPEVGEDGISLHDELDLCLGLAGADPTAGGGLR